MDPVSIGLMLAPLIPKAIGLFAGKDAEKHAQSVVDIAQSVTGKMGLDAVEAIKADKTFQLEFQKQVFDYMLEMARIDNDRLKMELDAEVANNKEVNATIREEVHSKDIYARRWRPALGYMVRNMFSAQMCGSIVIIAGVAWFQPKSLSTTIDAITAFWSASVIIWTMILTVLGINVRERTKSKEIASGVMPTSMISGAISSVVGAIKGKPGSPLREMKMNGLLDMPDSNESNGGGA